MIIQLQNIKKLKSYSVQPWNQIFGNDYGFLYGTKNMVENVVKIIRKKVKR